MGIKITINKDILTKIPSDNIIKTNNNLSIEERIEEFCENKGFSCHINIQGAFIKTAALAGWLIDVKGKKITLYHENYRGTFKRSASLLSNYHKHKLDDMSIENVLAYIEAHDYGKHNLFNIKSLRKSLSY